MFRDPSIDYNERKLRHVLRKTYLSFDTVHNTSTPRRTCSLMEFSTRNVSNLKATECQLVYVFVFGGNETRNDTLASDWKELADSSNSVHIVPKKIRNKENDVLYLNTGDTNHLHKIWNWYRYVYSEWKDDFDYIGITDTKVRVYPNEFWENPLFRQEPQTRIYAGLPVQKARCIQQSKKAKWCPSLKGEVASTMMMQRFTVLSNDLLRLVMEADPSEFFHSIQPTESLDVPLANFLQQLPRNISYVPLGGISPVLSSHVNWNDNIRLWDKYKDEKLQTIYRDDVELELVGKSDPNPFNASTFGPRLLVGIFTMDKPADKRRRMILRSTYLSYYKNSATPHRICSLQELESGTLPNAGAACQMAYTFVMGSNRQGPTELLEPNETHPLTIDLGPDYETKGVRLKETDIVHLNIKENMEDGKSPTWFKYATTVLEKHYFDYIGKTDTDTIIFPNYFLGNTLAKCPVFPDNVRVYGGTYRLKSEWAERQVGPVYMAGELYWMSPDLARFVTSRRCNRKEVDWGIEDFSMGNFVHSNPLPIHRIPIVGNKAHKHPVKLLEDLRSQWTKFLEAESMS